MPKWLYHGVDARGRLFTGPIEARDRDEAAYRLHQQGLLATDLTVMAPAGERAPALAIGRTIDRAALLAVTDILSSLLQAGLTIEQALTVALSLSLPVPARLLIEDTLHDVRGGFSLSEALTPVRGIPPYYLSLVRNGELTGGLGPMLARLRTALMRSAQVRAEIINAALYPALLIGVMFLSLLFLFADVVPRFAAMFAGSSVRLPEATRVLMAVAHFLHQEIGTLLLGLAASLGLLVGLWRSPAGRALGERLLLRTPALGATVINLELGRVFRTMGTLLAGGIPLTHALESVCAVPGNRLLQAALRAWHARLVAGDSAAEAIAPLTLLPPFVRQFIGVGNETGHMDEVFLTLADRLEDSVDRTIRRALSLVEPLAILLMGLLVGSVVVSILAAVFALNTVHV